MPAHHRNIIPDTLPGYVAYLLEMRLSSNLVNIYTKHVNVYTIMATSNKTQIVLSHDNS